MDPGFGVGRFERFVVRTSVMSPDNWFDQREWCYILSPSISIYEFYLTIGRDYLSFQFCQLTQATRNKMTTFPMKLLWEQGTAMLLFNPSINAWDELLGLRARYFGLHGSGVAVEFCSQFAMSWIRVVLFWPLDNLTSSKIADIKPMVITNPPRNRHERTVPPCQPQSLYDLPEA